MTRAQRTKRGFRRIAIAGSVLFLICGASSDIAGLQAHFSPLSIGTPKGTFNFLQSTPDDEIEIALAKVIADRKPGEAAGPWDAFLPVAYVEKIKSERDRIAEQEDDARRLAMIWGTIAVIWAAFWLAVSWIVRGFMN